MSGDLTGVNSVAPLASLFCQLARTRFTGVVYAERDGGGSIFSWREGRPVFVEALGEEPSIADMLLAHGLVTKVQYAEVATAVVESLAENEDVAFCEQLVKRGILPQARVDAEIARRLRGRVIQALAWESCVTEIDDDADALASTPDYPHAIGPLLYTAVRTFFDEDRVRALVGHEETRYLRLLRSEHEVAEFFGFDAEERALLARLQPDVPVADALEGGAADAFEGWQFVCALLLADMAELGTVPFSSVTERSGVRDSQAMTAAAAGQAAAGSARERPTPPQQRMPAVREERAPSQRRMPAVREERAPSQQRMPAVREGRAPSQQRMPAVREERAPSRPRVPPAREESAARVRGDVTAGMRHDASAPSQASNAARTQREAGAGQNAAGAVGGAAPSAKSLREMRKPRKLGTALKQLNRELKQLRPEPLVPVQPPAAAPAQNRAHIEQLMRMRHAKLVEQSQTPAKPAPTAPPGGAELYRSAQEALREQQFAKAHELLKKACEIESGNEIYAMYEMWAAFRAGALPEAAQSKLRLALRGKVSDDQHKGFAYYALGHLSLFEKKDEAAEKFFQKAVDLDKHNKDAERHLRIIQLRRKTAASDEKSSKIFGIEIRSKKS